MRHVCRLRSVALVCLLPRNPGGCRAGPTLGGVLKVLAAILACALVAGCTTTAVKSVGPGMGGAVAADTKVLLVQPDVQLALLTASGLQERRADWSEGGQANLNMAIAEALEGRSHSIQTLDPAASMEGRTGQLLRLHEAVGASVQAFEYSGLKLPTKQGTFDWTLGEGAQTIQAATGADYALFVTARGNYASDGRKAMMVGAALLGVSVPLGSQTVMASVVDLRTGRVVWFNLAIAGPQADIRTPEGARILTKDLLKGVPL